MKAIGLLLLCAGFAIVLCAFVLLSNSAFRGAFVLTGIMIQALGLILTFRAHYTMDEEL
jgi:protein-S-isoprenylcysteine O-methyltransferase Ste14